MARMYRNRVTIFFDEERSTSLRVYLATLEEVHVFLHYIRRCAKIPIYTCTQEFYKDTWVQSCEWEAESIDNNANAKRFEAAPFRLDITQWESKSMKRIEFSMYFFSKIDSDFISTLFELGTSREHIKLEAFNRDRDTGEWLPREVERFTPKSVAELYSSLSPEGKETAVAEMFKLKQLC